ncbi:hypothetical protein AX16_008534 [Volvariella volvacea WC 439]|nr:hypothetical protein AX16_008534 [Volvariella volvacea WC 439]
MSQLAEKDTQPLFPPPPVPPTPLGRYRKLSSRAGVLVSPLALGAMGIGDKWHKYGHGIMDKESSFKLLDAYFDAGGNFIDTAGNYQDGTSEEFIGEWAEKRGIRDQLVIATKYTNNMWFRSGSGVQQHAAYVGNHVKNMKLTLEHSLRKLRTSYVDIYYVHFWDFQTSVEEIMDGLHNLVVAGKVLYLGISDAPAWFAVKANEYARANGKTSFVVFQAPYSILERDLEREIMPMCQYEGMALTLWNVLGAGRIRSDEEEEKRRQTGEKGRSFMGSNWERTPDQKKICQALEVVAKQVGTKHITAVAIAYVLHKAKYVFPLIGGRKVEHLQANIEALTISLTPEQIQYLESILPFDVGLPGKFFGVYPNLPYPFPLASFVNVDIQPPAPLIQPKKQ